MAEPHWTGYVGMATGILGAITGIAGAIMGYVSYRKSSKIKALDLRLELRNAVNDLHLDFRRVKDLINEADRSKKAVNSAMGRGGGVTEKWNISIHDDRVTIAELFDGARKSEYDYATMDEKGLESELVAVHKVQGEIRNLLEKYREAIRKDEDMRKQLMRL